MKLNIEPNILIIDLFKKNTFEVLYMCFASKNDQVAMFQLRQSKIPFLEFMKELRFLLKLGFLEELNFDSVLAFGIHAKLSKKGLELINQFKGETNVS